MSELRDRIAAVLARHLGPYPETEGGNKPDRWDHRLADAVIEELGLRREQADEWVRFAFDGVHHHRYVTDWKADDE